MSSTVYSHETASPVFFHIHTTFTIAVFRTVLLKHCNPYSLVLKQYCTLST